jgi:putative tricarboxylic transport membrane protein
VVSYGLEKRIGKNKDKMGTGVPEGIASAETANNSATGAAIVPLITLGIPGDAVTAMLMGAFLLHGLRPGPSLFFEHADFVSSVFILFMLGNILLLIFGLLGIRLFVLVLQTPQKILLPTVLAFCVVGSYVVQNSTFDIFILLFFGVIGYFMRKVKLPPAPVILGFVLGPIVEENLRRSLILSDGNVLRFFMRPISCSLITATILLLFSPYIFKILTGRKIKPEE